MSDTHAADDFTSAANLEWIQSAVDYSRDATIQNAWSEMKADCRQLKAMLADSCEQVEELQKQLAHKRQRISQLIVESDKCTADAVELGLRAFRGEQ